MQHSLSADRKEAYFLFEEITVNDSKLKDKLGETNSEFYKNKKNKYKAIDCAVFRLDEGLEVFNLNNSDNIVVKNDLGLGHSIFVKNFNEYTVSNDLVLVKTTNMGSMFRLTYNVTLRDIKKEMIDKLRCRNGDLEITVSNQDTATSEL